MAWSTTSASSGGSRSPPSRRAASSGRARRASRPSRISDMVRRVPGPFAAFDAHVRAHQQEYVDELAALIRLPTVSAQKRAIDETAGAVLERTTRAGFAATAERVAGGPPT